MKTLLLGATLFVSVASFADTESCLSSFRSSEDELACIDMNKPQEVVRACKSAFSGPAINDYALTCIQIAPSMGNLAECKKLYSAPGQSKKRLNCLFNYKVEADEKSCELDIRKVAIQNLPDVYVNDIIGELRAKGFDPVMKNAYLKLEFDSHYIKGTKSSGFGFGLVPRCKSHKRKFSASIINMSQTEQKYVNGRIADVYEVVDSVEGGDYRQATLCEDMRPPKSWSQKRYEKALETIKALKDCAI